MLNALRDCVNLDVLAFKLKNSKMQKKETVTDQDQELQPLDRKISKSMEAIHFTVDPRTEMTLGAAKAFNAVNYLLQTKVSESRLAPHEYNERLGDGSIILRAKASEFMTLIGSSSRNYEYLKNLINELGNIRFFYDNFGAGADMDAGFLNMFTSGRIQKNEVLLVIPPHTRNILITSKPVAVIDFITLHARIKSKYSMALNDIVQQQMFDHDKPSKTFVLRDEVLRNALKIKYKEVDGVKVYSYREPNEFKRKVIEVAIKDYNESELDFTVNLDSYKKVGGTVYWTLFIESRTETLKRLLLAEMSNEIIFASKALSEFRVGDFKRNQFISEIVDDYSLQYLLYCIKLTRETKGVSNKAAYLISIYDNNKQIFKQMWEQKKVETENERLKRAENHKAYIEMQKKEFRSRYIKIMMQNMIEYYREHKIFPEIFQEELITHCSNLRKTLNANVFIKDLTENFHLDSDSPVFRSFCALYVEKHHSEELTNYVNNQTIELPA
jgi:hypothetical protein